MNFSSNKQHGGPLYRLCLNRDKWPPFCYTTHVMLFDNIIVLSASSKSSDGKFPNYMNGMYLGGQVRMDAAHLLIKLNPDIRFTIVGGYNELSLGGNQATSNKVNDIADSMDIRLNANVDLIYSLPCTHHNFVAVFNSWKKSGLRPQRIGILSNSYHLARALTFAKKNQFIFDGIQGSKFTTISAEDTLKILPETVFGKHINEYKKRLAREKEGLRKLQKNSYKDYCLTRDFGELKDIIRDHKDDLLTNKEKLELSLN